MVRQCVCEICQVKYALPVMQTTYCMLLLSLSKIAWEFNYVLLEPLQLWFHVIHTFIWIQCQLPLRISPSVRVTTAIGGRNKTDLEVFPFLLSLTNTADYLIRLKLAVPAIHSHTLATQQLQQRLSGDVHKKWSGCKVVCTSEFSTDSTVLTQLRVPSISHINSRDNECLCEAGPSAV